MGGLALKELQDADEAAYEEFLHGHKEALLYHSLRYKRFLTDLLGCGTSYWLAVRDGRILGVLPLMVRDGPWGAVWNSLPYFGSHGGVIARDTDASRALYHHYAAITSADDVAAATVVSSPFDVVDEGLLEFDLVDERIGQFVSLEGSVAPPSERFLAAVAGSTRRNLRKAQQAGVSVRIENAALDFVETEHRESMAFMRGRAKGPDFFRLINKYFTAGKDYNVYVGEIGGDTVAALLLFYYNRTVEYFTPVTRAAHRAAQPMASIIWTAMADAVRLGCTRWNWGGTWLNQTGLYRFKKKWNTIDRPYRYYTRVRNNMLLEATAAEVAAAYPGFYVVPFRALRG